ncbi:MAG: bifunctional diaminohydroxyphosphoribosylaminopyrimidine deaminase/5-amino-6-(5-phosphoribosylamino)uracil reductase RibD [Verrucomicrobiae bacterium]|nr:bifunctional diaminohydroxyphosphoribosylaminopyrimidine deaminase/5-amino-6-(5-phosphoribosylamino)uracil reductase RibD [Verrucomicrobiae bacterium]
MRRALALARKGLGWTSPNPMVGAVLVRDGQCLGEGWHRHVGGPHAEVEALSDARRRGQDPAGATLYVTLEPCSTQGRTPPCTEAVKAAGIRRVVVGATDPNPRHGGRGLAILEAAGVEVAAGVLAEASERWNEGFHHWIVRGTPFVTVKAAMTLDGRIATASGESKWITGPAARAMAMELRRRADGIVVGVRTVLADDPSLTVRLGRGTGDQAQGGPPMPRRWILDSRARTPLGAALVSDEWADRTTVVVTDAAPERRVRELTRRVRVWVGPTGPKGGVDLPWLLRTMGNTDDCTSLLVEGGGEVNASFLGAGLVQRVAFFYAPMVLGGRDALPGVGGQGAGSLAEALRLGRVEWRRFGPDLFLTARIDGN